MKPSSLIVVVAVVLIGGFAAADAIRGRAERSTVVTAPTEATQTTPTRLPGPEPQPDAPRGWPIGTLQGSLVFTDASDCHVRVIGLAGGREQPLSRFAGDCRLWVPPVGTRIAYGLGPASADGFSPFRVADLAQPTRELGGFRALFGVVVWSQDGQRVAWCGRRRTGFDLEIGGAAHRLLRCPSTYTPAGEIAAAVGNRLVVGNRTIFRAKGSGGITYAHYGTDGSLAVLVDGERLERWEGDTLTGSFAIPRDLQGSTPVLRFDNCAAAFPPIEGIGRIEVESLGCLPAREHSAFFGARAAWSPDGQWLAVTEPNRIAFHRIVGPEATIRWPAGAGDLAWRPR
jgi:hypothetical protein